MANNKLFQGLNGEEVNLQKELGNNNVVTVESSRSKKDIILKNTITLFNLLNLTLAIIVITIGSYKNMLFIFSIILNTGIGIYQELKAKKIIEKLTILQQKNSKVIREGQTQTILKEEIVVKDILLLNKGDQVPVDVICLEKGIYVDESMITGESDIIEKEEGSLIYSGSLVFQGNARTKVKSVGNSTFINKLTKEAKSFKKSKSKIQKHIDKILKIILIAIIPVTILVLLNQFVFTNLDFSSLQQREIAILGTTAAITSLIPEGLVLLISVALAASVIKLSTINVLAQDLGAIETLARVDTLCLDKTGTITEGHMTVEEIIYYKNEGEINDILSFIIEQDNDQNGSIDALKNRIESRNTNFELLHYVSFSSEIKQQAVEIKDKGVYILGAFDLVAPELTLRQSKDIKQALTMGYRILALAHSFTPINNNNIPKDAEIICLILIKDKPRKEAKQILEYFQKQGTTIKIISGDHPDTVLNIASDVGLKGKVLGLEELPENKEELQSIVETTTIFGRITPERKRDLILALQDNKHTVAMIGDGINDILALKKSDCAIALGSGNEATKSVAQFVLLNDDFFVLPKVVQEGRKVINNINRVAGMNLLRVIYTATLICLLLITRTLFPLESINLTLMGILTVGVPSMLLILEKDEQRMDDDFFQRIKTSALPGGVLIGITIFIMLMLQHKFPLYMSNHPLGLAPGEYLTDATLIIGTVQLFVMYLLCCPLSKYRALVLFGVTVVFYMTYFIPFITNFLGISPLHSLRFLIPTFICILLLIIIRILLIERGRVRKLVFFSTLLLVLSIFASFQLYKIKDSKIFFYNKQNTEIHKRIQ